MLEVVSRSIFVIEDDADAASSMIVLLTGAGHIVQMARNGREALELLSRHPRPDLIVLDLALPELDGREFRWWQLGEHQLADVPVLIASALDDARRTAGALRANGYLPKPLDAAKLLAEVQRITASPLV